MPQSSLLLVSHFPFSTLLNFPFHSSNKLISLGFVNPGCDVPLIADPHLYFQFTNTDFGSHIDEKRQREEFIGDRIYAACLLEVLEQWRLPRRCISSLFFVFTSNAYQQRLFRKWKIPEFLVEGSQEMSPGKPCADALEVRTPRYSYTFLQWSLSCL